MDNEYGSMFKRLMNERNELRKYIIDICGLLNIDTSQSVLGANCLEFYAVLSSVAKDKIKDLQEQLKRKEEECEKYKQTLTKIIRFLKEDKKFARYSGYPIVFPSIVIEEIEKILKENDIKIREVENEKVQHKLS